MVVPRSGIEPKKPLTADVAIPRAAFPMTAPEDMYENPPMLPDKMFPPAAICAAIGKRALSLPRGTLVP